MQIDVALVPQQADDWEDLVCIVVDVIRASTTLVTLFQQGIEVVYVAGEVDEARHLARERNCLLMGERGGVALPGFDYGNSPVAVIDTDFRGQQAVLTTSNGTAALRRVTGAKAVLVGALLNATACSETALDLAETYETDVGIVCAGKWRRFVLDDAVCAGVLVETLAEIESRCTLSDAAQAARRLLRAYPDVLTPFRASASGQNLLRIGQGDDSAYCAQQDLSDVVPILQPDAPLRVCGEWET
jgi:2-phosphosulfolactate phosphatase